MENVKDLDVWRRLISNAHRRQKLDDDVIYNTLTKYGKSSKLQAHLCMNNNNGRIYGNMHSDTSDNNSKIILPIFPSLTFMY